jgi:DNA-binding response OmpR family regulator
LSSQSDSGPHDGDVAHVLIVEDSEAVSSALQMLIESIGVRVSTSGSVAETLEIGLADPARLVLLDLTLPDGDGLAVIAPLRDSGSEMFVALTGHDDRETAERCRAAGCAEVLLKPVPARELVARVREWLGEF